MRIELADNLSEQGPARASELSLEVAGGVQVNEWDILADVIGQVVGT